MYQLYYMQYRRLIQYFSKNALRGIKRDGIHLEKSPQNKRAVVSWQGAQWGEDHGTGKETSKRKS